MSRALTVSLGQHSARGRKPRNQDFHGAVVPTGAALALKGVAVALADGISPSPVSHVAAETAVKSFLTDYYDASDAWTARTCGERVITATNAWLHGQGRSMRHEGDLERSYVCTFSALVLKGRTAHVFHVGDARVYRRAGDSLEPLTEDHRVVLGGESYLGRALGMAPDVAIDHRTSALAEGDLFVLCTDGLHSRLSDRLIVSTVDGAPDLDAAARSLAEAALAQGGDDDVTVQLVRVDALPEPDAADVLESAELLAAAPLLEPPAELDGYRLLRRIHTSPRSHIYLAEDMISGQQVALKVPGSDVRGDAALLRQFAMEEWIARRVSSPHLLRAAPAARPRSTLYAVAEHLDGVTLRQWMHDHPKPELEAVRAIVEQLAQGLRALHRKQMVHRDLRPENVMVCAGGLVKIIDFGSARVAGVLEAQATGAGEALLGSLQYSAPECLAGEAATWRSDLFSLGVIAYEMLTGRLPYGPRAARVRNRRQQLALDYAPADDGRRPLPAWVDEALRCAVHPDPARRPDALSDFVTDLRTPNPRHARTGFRPLAERDPVRFWQAVSLALGLVVLGLLARLAG